MNIRLLSLGLVLLTPQLFATPIKKNTASPEEKAFYAKGQAHMKKLVALCKEKKFDGDVYDATIIDKSINQTFEALEADKNSLIHQNAFNNYQSYLCGMRSELATYKPQGRNPQDAVVRYNKKTLTFALKAPNWETIQDNNRRESELFMRRMKEVRWEVLADLA